MFGAKPPFLVFPWQRSFLKDLITYVDEVTDHKPYKALLIFPHNRPWNHLVYHYAKSSQARLLPKAMTFEEVISRFLLETNRKTLPHASLLDATYLLYQAVLELIEQGNPFLESAFAGMEAFNFWPWGNRLVALLDDFYRQGLNPKDVANVEEDQEEHAKALLKALGQISDLYQAKLQACGLSTMGLDGLKAAEDLSIPESFEPSEHKIVLICGFASLDGAQEKLFKAWWQRGAKICLHTDPNLIASINNLHEACKIHLKWQERWGARLEWFDQKMEEQNYTPPIYKFFQGYDGHSELLGLRRDMAKSSEATQAIVLSDTAQLMPVLHHLPEKSVNVTMGYPLKRTLLGQLIALLFELEERSEVQGERKVYYWRDLLQLWRHPYLRNLNWPALKTEAEDYESQREELFDKFEQEILKGERYQDLLKVGEKLWRGSPLMLNWWQELNRLMLQEFPTQKNLKGLARVLGQILDFLVQHWRSDWETSPLDAQAFVRLREHGLEDLENALMQEEIPFILQKCILETLIDQARIPFEADPITGVQILGLLETRLLQFDQVYFLDATDDYLPGAEGQDPLMPETLRVDLGLPSFEVRKERNAYNFFRLCASSKEVYFYWPEGLAKGGTSEGRKNRSRYIEQLIWKEEQQNKKILNDGEPPLEMVKLPLTLYTPSLKTLVKTPEVEQALQTYIQEKGLSATLLNDYLGCPLRFARHYLWNIKEGQKINEGDSAELAGQWIHKILYEFYKDRLGEEITASSLDKSKLMNLVHDEKLQDNLEKLPSINYFTAIIAAEELLGKYLKNLPEKTTVLSLEEPLSAIYPLRAGIKLRGRIDRIDQRENGLIILDYKTGKVEKVKSNLSKHPELLEEIHQAHAENCQDSKIIEALCDRLKETLPSLQLPFYLALAQRSEKTAFDAAFVNLGVDGKELPFFGDEEFKIEDRNSICDDLLWLTITSLLTTSEFKAKPQDSCDYCTYRDWCLL